MYDDNRNGMYDEERNALDQNGRRHRYDEAEEPATYPEQEQVLYEDVESEEVMMDMQQETHYEEQVQYDAQAQQMYEEQQEAVYRITMKDAIRVARSYIHDIYEIEDTTLPGLMLEEVELSEDQTQWLITYGFDTDRMAERSSLYSSSQPRYLREYKQMAIDALTGEVQSMKIRKV